mmetsp:Transcript_32992/g.33600  ORF Transcript_32992/g.33600 Transcript_32992/m.33600 type:complete len:339 (-) Transcript_32992:6-1022(-)
MMKLQLYLMTFTLCCCSCYVGSFKARNFFKNSVGLGNQQSIYYYTDYSNRPGPWDEKSLDSLLDANKRWTQKMVDIDPSFFENHKLGHYPKILWIGCSDARVPANEIIGEPAGSVFVHRNIANMVVNTDFNTMSVIQYAVEVLKVKHIIVCGHYDCGGVKASLEPVDHKSPLENWLRNIRDTVRLHKEELQNISDPRTRQRRLVELNVKEQTINVFKTAVVQKRRIDTYNENKKAAAVAAATGIIVIRPKIKEKVSNSAETDSRSVASTAPVLDSIATLKKTLPQRNKPLLEYTNQPFTEPQVHAFVYDPATGELKRLKAKLLEAINELKEVYDLYKL